MEVTGSMTQAAERGRATRTDPGERPGTLEIFDNALGALATDLDELAEVVAVAEKRLDGVLHARQPTPPDTDDAAHHALTLAHPPTPLLERVHGVEAHSARVRMITADLRDLLGRVDL